MPRVGAGLTLAEGGATKMTARTLLIAVLASSTVGAVVAACAAQDETATSEAAYTRNGGVLGQAPTIKFAETKKGTINNGQIDVWGIDLREGDQITIVENISRGTLTPDFGLFAGGYSYIASTSHDAQPKKLTKNYVANTGGKHYIGIAAYQGQGSGNYNIKITCTGGPCAGQPFVAPLDVGQKNSCIQKTRECALTKARPSGGGSVTLAAARTAWSTCLAELMTDDGKACTSACEGESASTCTHATNAVQYFAGKSLACEGVFKSCMEECIDYGDNSDDSEMVCLEVGFNGTCDGYAKLRTECGGSVQPDSNEDCHELCHTTNGAWNDDLDDMCQRQCD
jgi:hypothetical protein